MGLKDKNLEPNKKATFSVSKAILYPYLTSGNPIPEKLKDQTLVKIVSNISEKIAGIDPATIKRIEERLKLTFLFEKDEYSHVCMANNPEVRDDYKDIFDLKDLYNYIYAVLHSPSYLIEYKDLSKIDLFETPYPNNLKSFWKLVEFGSKLRDLKLRVLSSKEKHSDETDKILKAIAEIKIE